MYLLTPMDIHDHQFKKAFRGYSENEVDDFLDKVVADFERLLSENERIKNQLYATETELEKYRGLEKTMNDTLIVAQRTADEVISTAKNNAETIQEQTARECQQVRDLAQLEGKKIIDAANMKRNAILADYSKLVGDRNAFLIKMRTILESELAITHHLIESLPKIEEVDKTPAPEEKPAVEVSIETSKTEETSKPEDAPKPEETHEKVEEDFATNIVNISTKPVTDETKTYAPIKESVK